MHSVSKAFTLYLPLSLPPSLSPSGMREAKKRNNRPTCSFLFQVTHPNPFPLHLWHFLSYSTALDDDLAHLCTILYTAELSIIIELLTKYNSCYLDSKHPKMRFLPTNKNHKNYLSSYFILLIFMSVYSKLCESSFFVFTRFLIYFIDYFILNTVFKFSTVHHLFFQHFFIHNFCTIYKIDQ